MNRRAILKSIVVTILALAVVIQPLSPALALAAQATPDLMRGDRSIAQATFPCFSLYIPSIILGALSSTPNNSEQAQTPAEANAFGPEFSVISPQADSDVSGTTIFAIQQSGAQRITKVTFQAGRLYLGTDTTAEDGFQAFLNTKLLPAGPLQMTAFVTGPCGQSQKTITVNVVSSPPASNTIGASGGVLASEIGSVITIPPGAVPDGTKVSVTERSQQQITAQTGIDWDSMGVTFLGAQDIHANAPFAKPLGVSSAGFGNRVQPGQAIVNYRIVPDANGDGVDELVVVNTASVAPNNDVVADPVPAIELGEVTPLTDAHVDSRQTVQMGISGPPGEVFSINGSGFNPASPLGNIAKFHSLVDGIVWEVPIAVSVDPNDSTRQVIDFILPPMAIGAATLTLRNDSSAASAGPFNLTVLSSPPLSGPPSQIIDAFLTDEIALVENLPASLSSTAAYRVEVLAKLTELRQNFQEVANLPYPEIQQLLGTSATVIKNSGLLSQSYTNGTSPATFTPEANKVINRTILVLGVISLTAKVVGKVFPACEPWCSAIEIGAAGAALVFKIWQEIENDDTACITITLTPANSSSTITGMGSVPPSGGSGCGNAIGPNTQWVASGTNDLSRKSFENMFQDQAAGRYVVKIKQSSLTIPFTGLTDAGGYFFVPMIPQNEPFTATAIDTWTNQQRSFSGTGPLVGKSVFMNFDFSTGNTTPEHPTYWTGGGDGASWDDALNWDKHVVPQATDDVFLDTPGTSAINLQSGAHQIHSLHNNEVLSLSGGTLDIAAPSQNNSTINWTGGTLSGAGTLINAGAINIDGAATKTISGLDLANPGTITWKGSGQINVGTGTVIDNLPTGLFDMYTDAPISSFGNNTTAFNNAGIVRKSDGTGKKTFAVPLSGGNVEVLKGTLAHATMGQMTGGNFTVTQGAVFQPCSSNACTLTGYYTGSGAGTILHSGGNVMIIGAAGATFDFGGNLFQWTGGYINGPGKLTNNGTINISGSPVLGDTATKILRATIDNAGAIIWSGDGAFTWESAQNSPCTLNNLATGQIEIQNNRSFGVAGGKLINAGTIFKSGATGVTTFDGDYTQAATGVLKLRLGGINPRLFDQLAVTNATLDGELNVSAINGFAPAAGNTFQVLRYTAHTGSFATVNGNGYTYAPQYNAAGMTLMRQ